MQLQRVCHDTMPWLISFSLDGAPSSLFSAGIGGAYVCMNSDDLITVNSDILGGTPVFRLPQDLLRV
jgi:hypothetical protein